MRESGYYPPGAEFDPNAPWNEHETPDKDFDVLVSQTLSKNTEVTTNDYVHVIDQDEDGCYEYDDTCDTDWHEAYKQQHLTPLQLIEKFKKLLTTHLPDPVVDIKRYKEFKNLIEECEGWEEDELEIVKE